MILLTAPSEGEKRPLLYEPGYVARIFQASYVNVKRNSPCLIQLSRTSAADERTAPPLICKTLCEIPSPAPRLPSKSKKEKAQISGRDILVPFLRMLLGCKRGAAPDGRLPDVCDFHFVRVEDKGFNLKRRHEKDHLDTSVVLYALSVERVQTWFFWTDLNHQPLLPSSSARLQFRIHV